MTTIGLDDAAHARALAVTEGVKKRLEVRHEHTREIVRQDIPQDVVDLIRAMAKRQSELEARVAALETAVALMSSAKLDEKVSDLKAVVLLLAEEAARARAA